MKKGETYTGIVEKIDFPNKAMVITESENPEDHGKKVIVKNSILGQKVRFTVNKKRKDKCEGRLIEVVEKSLLETTEACEHFGQCGGCVYQTMDYDKQLEMKSEQVKKLLDEVIESDYTFEGILGSPVCEEYRNKMEFSFGDESKDGPVSLGMHKRNSMYDVVTVTSCKIVDEDYRKILECVYRHYQNS